MLAKALTIAGFDASGGAGIQADLKTFSALGCYGMSVLTALPIQNTCGVSNCYSIPLTAIEEQLDSIFSDITPDVIKIGMLFNSEIVNLVAQYLKQNAKGIPVVVDPVMVAKSGDMLLLPEAVSTLKEKILPLATVVTPNTDEAEVLFGHKINTQEAMLDAARQILETGVEAVFLKGGHMEGGMCQDLLFTEDKYQWFISRRIKSKNTHGTGCTLSAAIASGLARGDSLVTSCSNAKEYITQAILSFQYEAIGKGHGPVNHFHAIWKQNLAEKVAI
ncbi:bifunctional hydroxymethylpyrimidine kinase/phosphomethylpyrimidine kinase [Aquella oligotrophica]|uniref:hydroxymethylpyrimidine kinase n=1 Tax=Aquella oligotrophica TaxID=2067065 RepID=A0A2I7N928_9NEIS|nr:bifunctional hydroxymethylpyrimidine kinase/phosphomethylpyrimidine kinase [Aquella oligotrophica]AUR52949.1 bifunctional hydroxymethylpyrimidine kinase/phosphomethylpyrimidine kinase [Aquella oligotrophica]